MRRFVVNRFNMVLRISSIFFILSTICAAGEKKKIYSVQLGAFKQLNNALSHIKRIKKLGHQPFYRHETIEDRGKLYIVYIGRYESREEA